MAVASYAASVQGVALRVTRLDAQGFPMTGPENVYVTRAFMRVSFTPEYEDGDEITEKNAAGEVCVTYKAPDTLKRATMEVAICDPDPEFTELVAGGVLLKYDSSGKPPAVDPEDPVANFTYPGATVGYASVKVGESPNPNGVGIEVWSLAIKDGARDSDLPYYRWVFPKATLRPSGDRVIENGLLANTFEGWSVGNIHFGTGPADDWYWPDATDRPFLYARDFTNPWSGTNGWVEYPNAVSDTGVPELDPATGLRLIDYGVTNVAPSGVTPTGVRPYNLYVAEDPTYGSTAPTATVTGATQGVQGAQFQAVPTGPPSPSARRATPEPPQQAQQARRPQGPDAAQGSAEFVQPETATGSTGATGTTGNKSE